VVPIIGNDKFVQVFGSVPAGDDTLLVQIVANAVREKFHIVLCEPGTATPVCTLPVTQQKREHECGVSHVLSLESLLGPTTAKELNDITGVWESYWEPKELAKVRAKVQAVINRVTKQHDGVKPNIGVIPGPSGYVVLTTRWCTEIGPTVYVDGYGEWYWFQVPSDTQFARNQGLVMVPPSTLDRGAMRLIGQISPAPAWLLERITMS
jgi:hypothetical protein